MATKTKTAPKQEGLTSAGWWNLTVQLRANAKEIDSQKNEAIQAFLYKKYQRRWPTWAINEARVDAKV